MGNLSFNRQKWDKNFFFAFLITLICSIICGIVLCVFASNNAYLRDLACDYVYNCFNFNNSSLFLAHLLGDVLYFYLFFLIAYFTRFKYINLIFLFLRGLFFGVYIVLLCSVSALGGVIAFIFVFLPATVISIIICYLLCEFCRCCDNKLVLIIPAILAILDGIILLLLLNVVFRVVIIIV